MTPHDTHDQRSAIATDEDAPRVRSAPPRACALDYLLTLSIGLQLTVAALCLIPAYITGGMEQWFIRTLAGVPLMTLTALLVRQSLKHRDRD